ncbi:MAG: plastocyanin [Candidatus Nitrosomirales archaeon]|jgi:plastocyanin
MKLQYVLGMTILTTLLLPITHYSAYAVMEVDTTVDIEAASSDANSGKSFDPKELTIGKGTSVTWINQDSQGHTVTSGHPVDSDTGALFDSTKDLSGLIKPGVKWEHTFDTVGEFPYFCQIHSWMTGKVIVMEKMETVIPQMTATTPLGVKVTLTWTPDTIEPTKETTFTLKFFDKSGSPINDATYDFMLLREGSHITHRSLQSISQGTSVEKVTFKEDQTGSVTLRLENINLTSGETAEFSIQVVPEFPISVAIVMASMFAIMTLVNYRYKSFRLFRN